MMSLRMLCPVTEWHGNHAPSRRQHSLLGSGRMREGHVKASIQAALQRARHQLLRLGVVCGRSQGQAHLE